jgi:hypothetical protein
MNDARTLFVNHSIYGTTWLGILISLVLKNNRTKTAYVLFVISAILAF